MKLLNEFLTSSELFSSPSVLQLLIKITLVLLLVFLARAILIRRSASLRHAILFVGLISVPMLIVAHIAMPSWSVAVNGSMVAGQSTIQESISKSLFRDSALVEVMAPSKSIQSGVSSPTTSANWVAQKVAQKVAQGTPSKEPHSTGETTSFPVTDSVSTQCPDTVIKATPGPAIQWPAIILLAWIAGCLFFVSRLAIAWSIVAIRARRTENFELPHEFRSLRALHDQILDEGIAVKISPRQKQMPMCVCLFQKTMVLPAECEKWELEQLRSVLLHEYAHFTRGDCWINLVSQVVHALLWFHPLAWWLVRSLRSESEIACDDLVLNSGVAEIDYASSLFHVATTAQRDRAAMVVATSMADCSPLERRMKFILSDKTPRQPVSRFAFIALLVLILAGTCTVGTVSLSRAASVADASAPSAIGQAGNGEEAQPDLEFKVTMKDGRALVGGLEGEFEVETSFGRAYLDAQQIRLIKATDSGNFQIETADDSGLKGTFKQDAINLVSSQSETSLNMADISKVVAVGNARLVSGSVTDGFFSNGLSYHVRVPKIYDPKIEYPAIVLLHTANSNSKTYVETFQRRWPKLAEKYLLIGINGEHKRKEPSGATPEFNYSYVNFVGTSKLKGFPGSERESPALVRELLISLRDRIPISKLFVGGHSDGGFLTMSVLMNYPELIDGAFSVAGGMLVQNDPEEFDNETVRAGQRNTPYVLLHSPQDKVMGIRYSQVAYRTFLANGFANVRFMDKYLDGHDFEASPIDDAIQWLEGMTAESPLDAAKFIHHLIDDGQIRVANGMIQRMEDSDSLKSASTATRTRIDEAEFRIRELAKKGSIRFSNQIKWAKPGDWVQEYLNFQTQFEFVPAAEIVIAEFKQLRSKHDADGERMYKEARALIDDDQEMKAVALCRSIVEKRFASKRYSWARKQLAKYDKSQQE